MSNRPAPRIRFILSDFRVFFYSLGFGLVLVCVLDALGR